ncbi:MAG: hypothetical protein HC880_10570, partial [Bacteroidia bacterium]|nr:hypothetical protein [Bacteroidia bacterium]
MTWVYTLFLFMESYYRYQTFFQFLHVPSKVLQYFLIFIIYGFYKRYNKISLIDICWIIIISVIVNGVTVNSDAFTLGAFLEHRRYFGAPTVLALLIPLLYFFNQYFITKLPHYILLFLGILGFIIFIQHRTVWVTSFFALGLNILFWSRTRIKFDFVALMPFAVIISIMMVATSIYVMTD